MPGQGSFKCKAGKPTAREEMRGKHAFPSFFLELHFLDFDALIRAHFYARQATNAFSCLEGISFAV